MAKGKDVGPSGDENGAQDTQMVKVAPVEDGHVEDTNSEESADMKDKNKKWYHHQDVLVFIAGFIFIGALLGAMFGFGEWRNWYAPSGDYHNSSITSPIRFLPEPADSLKSGAWYYWMNKPEETSALTRLFVWVCYLTHQFSMWIVIFLAQAEKVNAKGPKYQDSMNKYGWMGFGITIFFHILHLIQTQTTYDALAKDVTITSSQCSVIMLLIVVLVMEYTERGFMLGWPTLKHTNKVSQKLRLNLKPSYMLRKYHGYAVAWASIYTFWYHPMENTYGHAMGFIYTFLFMLQGSLMYTKLHLNPWWRLFQEVWLIIHGGLVAFQTGGGNRLWPMFTFGPLLIFALTWIYLLPFWERIPFWARVFPPIIYVIIVLCTYPFIPNEAGQTWARMTEVLSIPGVFYGVFFVPWLTLYIVHLIQTRMRKSSEGQPPRDPSTLVRVFSLLAFVAVYGFNIGLSVILHVVDLNIPFFVAMIILCIVFSFTAPLGMVAIEAALPKRTVSVKPQQIDGNENLAFEKDSVKAEDG